MHTPWAGTRQRSRPAVQPTVHPWGRPRGDIYPPPGRRRHRGASPRAGPGYGRVVAHDLVAEGRRILADGLPEPPARLSRRHRLAALAADTDGDVAAVLFARRGTSGQPWFEVVVFERGQGGGWESPGGSGGQAEEDILDDRPPSATLGAPLRWEGGGACRGRLAPRLWARAPGSRAGLPGLGLTGLRGRRVLNHTLVRAAAETGQVRVRGAHGERTLPVHRHGQLVVVWRGRAAPSLTPCSQAGVRIGPEVSVVSGGW